ncbi:MAG: periplasmic heavy metal sensor [Bacteroidales bacterium]|nr:periplasmic heavy metal sensor [Bacteroidales bacterium]MCF8327699.1 periplasmic heavy metal sensor [Bacteroidales bacterium]
MDINKQKKLITWAVIILVIINLGAIGLLIYRSYTPSETTTITRPAQEDRFHDNRGHRRGPGQFLQDRFQFNEAQLEKFNQSVDEHQSRMQEIKDSISLCRKKLVEEVVKDNPDTATLEEYIKRTGILHSKMQRETTNHFLEIQKIASPEQKEEIRSFLLDMPDRRRMNSHREHRRGRPNHRNRNR